MVIAPAVTLWTGGVRPSVKSWLSILQDKDFVRLSSVTDPLLESHMH